MRLQTPRGRLQPLKKKWKNLLSLHAATPSVQKGPIQERSMTSTVTRAIVSTPRYGIYMWVVKEEISRTAQGPERGNATAPTQLGQRKPTRCQQAASGGGSIWRYQGRILRLG